MPNEIERAFAGLADEAGRVRLSAAEDVRRSGDHRATMRAVTSSVVAAVLVAGVAVGARVVLGGPDSSLPPTPAHSLPSRTPSGSPSPSAPSPSAPSPSAPSRSAPSPSGSSPQSGSPSSSGLAVPRSIPDIAFLRAADFPGSVTAEPERLAPGASELPPFCWDAYGNWNLLAVRAAQRALYRGLSAPPNPTPESYIYEDIMVFRGNGSTAFMDDLRTAVRNCPSKKDDSGMTLRYYLRGSLNAGNESVLIEQTRPATGDDGTPTGHGLRHVYWAVIRVGDVVAFVGNYGYESISADRDDTVQLGRRAAVRVWEWR